VPSITLIQWSAALVTTEDGLRTLYLLSRRSDGGIRIEGELLHPPNVYRIAGEYVGGKGRERGAAGGGGFDDLPTLRCEVSRDV